MAAACTGREEGAGRASGGVVARAHPVAASIQGCLEATDTHETLMPGSIPEVVLVSLNVIRERYPSWLNDPDFWAGDLRRYVKKRAIRSPRTSRKRWTD